MIEIKRKVEKRNPSQNNSLNWVRIFATSGDMAGALKEDMPRLLIVGGRRICLVVHKGVLLAVEDSCPHNGESLSKGAVNYLGEIVCPWHGQRFNLHTGRECAERSRDLVTYPVRELPEGIFIGL